MTYIYEVKQSGDLYHDLKKMGRDNFSYEGATALMDSIEETAQDTGVPIEYDPIAFCCEYTEYSDLEEFNAAMNEEFESIEEIADKTTLIQFEGGFIVADY